MTENEHQMTELPMVPDEPEMDIIHNVPLDPRAAIEEPLTIPREVNVLTLSRHKVSLH